MKNMITILLVFSLVFIGCSKDGTENQFTYEVTGDVEVPITIKFTPSITKAIPDQEDLENYEEISTLPWKKTVSMHPNVMGIGCIANAKDLPPGKFINVKIYKGTKVVADFTGETDQYEEILVSVNYDIYNDRATRL